MKEHQIMLNATEDVKEFVNAASKCDFDIDISYNRIIIDAKSLLGILSMDLTRKLTVRCYGENTHFKICSCINDYKCQRRITWKQVCAFSEVEELIFINGRFWGK